MLEDCKIYIFNSDIIYCIWIIWFELVILLLTRMKTSRTVLNACNICVGIVDAEFDKREPHWVD